MTHNSLTGALEEIDLLDLWHLLFLQKQRCPKQKWHAVLRIENVDVIKE